MERNGRKLRDLGEENPRRMSDGRNAFRKMSDRQRAEFLAWIADEFGRERGVAPGRWLVSDQFCLIDYGEAQR